MAEEFVRKGLATSVAQICSNIGWHTMSNSTLQMMTDILYEYFKDLARSVKKFSEISDSITPDIDDVKMAFRDKDVALPDLIKYLKQVGSVEFPHEVPKFPVPTNSNLNIMKPGSREIVTRPVYVHEHLPTMYPEQSDDKANQNESCSNQNVNSSSSLNIFNDTLNFQETQTFKNDRTNPEKMITHRQLREISSVVMTSSGFLSPSREGKLPESRLIPMSNLKASCSPMVEQLSNPKLPKEVKDVTINKQPLPKIPNCVKEKEKSIVEVSNNNSNANNSIKKNEIKKVKKLTNLKGTPKIKPLKKGAISELNQEAQRKKPPKIKNKSKLNLLNTIFDKPAQAKHPKKTPGEKLITEPNKQKLNIFKKIPKIKDDKNNELHGTSTSKTNVSVVPKVNSTVVSSNIAVKPEINLEVEEEKLFQPVFFKPVEKISECKSPKIEPIEELNTEMNQKRKKKQKIPTIDLKPTSSIDSTSNNSGTKKSKTKHDSEIYSKFSFFGPLTPGFLQPGPSLLPPSLASNPLVPKYTAPNRVLPILDKDSPMNSMMYLPLPEEDGIDKSKLEQLSPSFNLEKEKVSAEKIKPKKGHKKIKKEKIKSKKKKDKKDKSKDKSKSERKKEKLLKKKKSLDTEDIVTCKEEPVILEDKQETTVNEDSLVPKIKLKLTGSTESTSAQRKIVIKPLVKNKSSEGDGDLHHVIKETLPVEQIKSSTSKSKIQPKEKSSIPTTPTLLNPTKQEDTAVVLNSKPSSSKTSVIEVHTPSVTSGNVVPLATDSTQVTTSGNKHKAKTPKKIKKTQSSQSHPAFYFDESGNQVWICPTCTKKDDGSPMIGCDGCDAWYHWVCVGIQCPPDCAVWYCPKCLTKRAERGGTAVSGEKAKRGRPLKKKISTVKN